MRVPSTALGQPAVMDAIVTRTMEQLRGHRQAIVMARVGAQTFADALAWHDAGMPGTGKSQSIRPQSGLVIHKKSKSQPLRPSQPQAGPVIHEEREEAKRGFGRRLRRFVRWIFIG